MDNQPTLLEIYKMYVQTAESTSDRRRKSNRFYLTLCSSLITVFAIIIKIDIIDSVAYMVVGFFGIALSAIWFFNIKSYGQLNSGKFKVIFALEKKLPFACFTEEWKELGHIGDKPKTYRLLTKVESFVPLIFVLGFIALIIDFFV